MVKKIKETMSGYGMTDPGDTVVVAVSGGPDSVCLLDVLNDLSEELEIRLVVAHFNHGLRAGEDESETALVGRLAESMGLPFETDKALFLRPGSSSLEAKARDARYRFLKETSKKYNAQKIAVGHNLNDQAETVLMRFLRGSGPSGLAGMPPKRDNRIIRPLIEIKREMIMDYLRARELPFALDSSNKDTAYLRNRIRLELLPMMQDYQPRIIEHLGRLSDILRAEDDFLESRAAEWVERESEKASGDNISVPVSSLEKLHPSFRNRVIRLLLKKRTETLQRIDSDHIQTVSGLISTVHPQAMLDLPNGVKVIKVYDRLIFSLGKEKSIGDFRYTVKGPGTIYLEAIDRTIRFEEMDKGIDMVLKNSASIALLNADKLRYPLIIRNFRPGDNFIPLGMTGHRKIKDFFIDQKIPSRVRAETPILLWDNIPVWICGFRIDDRFKITSKTKKILKVTMDFTQTHF